MIIKGLILVHNPPSWYRPSSWTLEPAIRWAAGTRFNHCALLVEIDGQRLVLEALGKGVVLSAYAVWKRRAKRETDFTPLERPGDHLYPLLGVKYDRSSLLFYFGLKLLTGRWYGPTGERARKQIFCYELAALAYGHPQPWGVLPKDLENFVLNLPMAV